MIYIIRHGQTQLNQQNVLQGRSDYPLNETGIQQAMNAAELLRGVSFRTVFSSPLIRAVETAECIAPNCVIRTDIRLIEMDYGPYEGMGLSALTPEVVLFFQDFVHNPAPDGMEQLEHIVKRTGQFLEEKCRTEDNILLSTHAIAMKGILEYLTPDSHGSYWSKYIGNCEIYTAEYRSGSFTVPVRLSESGSV